MMALPDVRKQRVTEMFQRHLHFTLIADIAEGRVSPDEATLAHLNACPACSADLRWLQRVIGLLRSDASEEPAEQAVGLVKGLFRLRRPQRSAWPEFITAIARFDSARMTPAFGLRAAGSIERQLLFAAGPYEIDLRVTPAGNRWALRGQLLGEPLPERGRVAALGPAGAAEVALGAESEFALPPLRAGHYNLALHLPQQTIVLPDVELGA
jgi:hypothetical protein